MSRQSFFLLFFIMGVSSSFSKGLVSCRVAIENTKSCTPYPFKFLRTKEVQYDKDRQKLIVKKTLPSPVKPTVSSPTMVDLIEKYVQIESSVRFKSMKQVEDEVKQEEKRREEIYNRLKQIKEQREKLFASMYPRREPYIIENNISTPQPSIVPTEIKQKNTLVSGTYCIKKGDTLSHIAVRFGISMQKLIAMNHLKKSTALKIGKPLTLPFSQKRIDSIAQALYIVQEGDNLGSIALDFNLTVVSLMKFNKIKKEKNLKVGMKLSLPLAYKLKKNKKLKVLEKLGTHKLRVTATAYSSHANQTDSTPFLAAWNNKLRPGMKIIAVSRDLLKKYGMRNGTKVKISGLSGIYRVRDKMNKRYSKRIDIYTGVNRRKALRWGRRSVVIYW